MTRKKNLKFLHLKFLHLKKIKNSLVAAGLTATLHETRDMQPIRGKKMLR